METRWGRRAKTAAATGPDKLRAFLCEPYEPRNDAAFALLHYISLHHHNNDLIDAYFSVFSPSPTSPRYHRLRSEEARPVLDRLSTPYINEDLSLYGIFKESVFAANQARSADPYDAPSHIPPLTQLIWDRTKSQLYCQGAVIACVEFGLHDLLQQVLAEIQTRHHDHNDQQLAILFQLPQICAYTAIGNAIFRKRIQCFQTLHLTIEGAADYILSHPNVVTTANIAVSPLLHWSLDFIKQRLTLQGASDDDFEEEEELLRRLIDLEPQLLTQQDIDGRTPLRQAQDTQESVRLQTHKKDYEQLEAIVRDGIYHRLKDPEEWRRALYSRSALDTNQGEFHDTADWEIQRSSLSDKEVSLDLSDFNYGPQYFQHFLDHLETFHDKLKLHGRTWEFETTLLFLILPNLSRANGETQLMQDTHRSCLARFLLWLRNKGVKRIIKLKLPDSSCRYTYEWVYQNILSFFQVDELDWTRLDVRLDGFAAPSVWTTFPRLLASVTGLGTVKQPETTPPTTTDSRGSAIVRAIHLYSHDKFDNNKMAFLDPRKLPCFEKLETIYLNLIYDMTKSELWRDLLCDESRRRGSEVVLSKGPRVLTWQEFALEPEFILPQANQEFKLLQDLAPCRDFLFSLRSMKDNPVDPQTKHCRAVFQDKSKRVKIAVIDNGVDQMATSSANIVRGASFVRSASEPMSILPWYTPVHPHGTQMADLIRCVNPWCELFPIRVGSLRKDVDIHAAVDAIEWALDNKVDIISASWIIKTDPKGAERFKAAIHKATERGVLVICATADVGAHDSGGTWPANFANVISISASNEYGLPMPWSFRDVDAMLIGDQIKTSGPGYMRLGEDARESGSSIATAIAAGLASLCLFLARMANEDNKGERFKDRHVMLALFRMMQVNDADKVIEPSRVFNREFKPPVGYQGGRKPPPVGLDIFRWRHWQNVDFVDRRGSIAVSRRALSRQSSLSR
ncbi:hypothetical protein B0A52_10270 [Exophiala mesophila]|uniref:Peptidase S8/S53 domain-containing protein n=1 Tax=Exophiala mesophila TaxID=212818 RepID=A0A438MRW7_EXOME|nr:hypothetical protein B0A52_10270 [Exophiala mesophila]